MIRTEGYLLGGRVRHDQPAEGFRSGIEPVLLAAAIPARQGDHVLEAGTGAGAALLCLAQRAGGVVGIGVEREPALAVLARDNARLNQFDTLAFIAADVARLPLIGPFDHAFANPPYHLTPGTRSSTVTRDRAKRGEPALLTAWADALASRLRPRGTLTFILPAAHLPICLGAMTAAGCGVALVIPLWPRMDRPARLVIVQAVRGGRMATVLHPGLILHQGDGSFTFQADAILRRGKGLFEAEPATAMDAAPKRVGLAADAHDRTE